jgi:hypothetical protein
MSSNTGDASPPKKEKEKQNYFENVAFIASL